MNIYIYIYTQTYIYIYLYIYIYIYIYDPVIVYIQIKSQSVSRNRSSGGYIQACAKSVKFLFHVYLKIFCLWNIAIIAVYFHEKLLK